MKIVGINSSPRGDESRTLRLVRAVLDGARENGAEVELVDVCLLNIEYCTGCAVCYECGECIYDDDFSALLDKMCAADGIVLGSPNYINSVTAQLKTMLDRMADAIHCQMFTGKYGCAVCTAGGSGADEVADYLNRVLVTLGASTVGSVGVVIGADENLLKEGEERAYDLGKELVNAIQSGATYPAQEAVHREMRERMKQLVTAHRDIWSHEYEYWTEKGWMDE